MDFTCICSLLIADGSNWCGICKEKYEFRGLYGAATLVYTNLLKIISETIEDDLVIFPSSIHEFIFMPAHTVNRDYKELKEIVESINATVLSKEEFLSNNIYLYDRINDKLQIAE